ncbi:MAG: FHA domain-containing protein [Bacteroidales bacterium]|nr:FHA domain-containing protein [Bacteroidales bacterium]
MATVICNCNYKIKFGLPANIPVGRYINFTCPKCKRPIEICMTEENKSLLLSGREVSLPELHKPVRVVKTPAPSPVPMQTPLPQTPASGSDSAETIVPGTPPAQNKGSETVIVTPSSHKELRLEVQPNADTPAQTLLVQLDRSIVGRKSASHLADVEINTTDAYMSRPHCIITRKSADMFTIKRHEDKNGTMLNGKPLKEGQEVYLENGSVITMGHTQVKVIIS